MQLKNCGHSVLQCRPFLSNIAASEHTKLQCLIIILAACCRSAELCNTLHFSLFASVTNARGVPEAIAPVFTFLRLIVCSKSPDKED